MITRIWHGRIPAAKAEAYRDYLVRTGVRDYRATRGNRGVQVLMRRDGEEIDVLVISTWESREAIRAFAGRDVERARYYPEDDEFLLEREPAVRHYDCVFTSG